MPLDSPTFNSPFWQSLTVFRYSLSAFGGFLSENEFRLSYNDVLVCSQFPLFYCAIVPKAAAVVAYKLLLNSRHL